MIDTRSDIYSLGVLLYELLTGSTPFEREQFNSVGLDEVRRIIREVDPPKDQATKPGRYDPCPCNSGKKYKFCCERVSRAR